MSSEKKTKLKWNYVNGNTKQFDEEKKTLIHQGFSKSKKKKKEMK